jgi:hypothetical protein
MRSLFIQISGAQKRREQGLYHPGVIQAIVEPDITPKSYVTLAGGGHVAGGGGAKTLCTAVKRFDLARCRAIDRRQPYRWARFSGDASCFAAEGVHPEVLCGVRAAEWSW